MALSAVVGLFDSVHSHMVHMTLLVESKSSHFVYNCVFYPVFVLMHVFNAFDYAVT